ncbi:hypothetical protein EON76_04730 [bacterium]|nr:MAG: hypothetical protein EON76_04730 [bacterium]
MTQEPYVARTIDDRAVRKVVDLSTLNIGDIVEVVTENECRYFITITELFFSSDQFDHVTGVDVESEDEVINPRSDPVRNKVTKVISVPSMICINHRWIGPVDAIMINDPAEATS